MRNVILATTAVLALGSSYAAAHWPDCHTEYQYHKVGKHKHSGDPPPGTTECEIRVSDKQGKCGTYMYYNNKTRRCVDGRNKK